MCWIVGGRIYRKNSQPQALELGAFLGCQQGDNCEWGQVSNEQSDRVKGREGMRWGLGTKWQGLAGHVDLTRNWKDFNFCPVSNEEPLNEEYPVGFCFNKFTLASVWVPVRRLAEIQGKMVVSGSGRR